MNAPAMVRMQLVAVMLGALALAPSTGAARAQDPPIEKVEDVIERLRAALDGSSAPQKVAALRAAARHADPRVVAQARRGLADEDADVRVAAIDALGRNSHDKAFEALLEHHREHRKRLRSLDRDLPALLAAVARRGDPRALHVLTDDVRAQMLAPTLRARMLGLARIRSKESIEALFALADEIGFIGMHNHLEDFRLALLVLSHVDHGRSLDAWRAWWTGVKSQFELPEKAPELSATDYARWREFWRDELEGEARSG